MGKEVVEVLKILADPSRLRLLVLLEVEELSVGELVKITEMGQPRVSHHLGLLRGAGLVRDRREGTSAYYRMEPPAADGALPTKLWNAVGDPFRLSTRAHADRARLAEVREARRERSRRKHDALAGVWRLVGQDLEFGSLRSEALAAMTDPDWVIADLGCGAGFFSGYLASRVRRVIAVDHSQAMLREARSAVDPEVPVEFRHGELEALPLGDGEVDAVTANLVFHHLADFHPVVREMCRVLRPGGVAVISDLRPHREEWMHEELGDLRLGIDPSAVVQAFRDGGFERVHEIPAQDRYRLRSPGGRTARLEIFLVRAQRSQGLRKSRMGGRTRPTE